MLDYEGAPFKCHSCHVVGHVLEYFPLPFKRKKTSGLGLRAGVNKEEVLYFVGKEGCPTIQASSVLTEVSNLMDSGLESSQQLNVNPDPGQCQESNSSL